MSSVYLTEWIKLKRSPILSLLLFWLAFITGINFLYVVFESYAVLTDYFIKSMSFYVLCFATAFVFSREYHESTISHLLTYPQGSTRIYFGKMLVVYSLLTITILPTIDRCSMSDIYLLLMYFMLIPLLVLVGIVFRNLILAMVVQFCIGAYIKHHFILMTLPNKNIYHPYIIYNLKVEMIGKLLYEFFFITHAKETIYLVCLAVSSVLLGIYLFSRTKMKRG